MNFRRVGMVAGIFVAVGIVGAALVMAVNLVRFEHASSCGSRPSRNCIVVSTGIITSPGRQVDNSWCGAGPAAGCYERVDYSIDVTPEGSAHEVELWDVREHPDFRVGDTVELERWHGQYVAVTHGSHRVEVNDWNPRLLEELLVITPVSGLAVILLWRFRVISLSEPIKGFGAKLKSAFSILAVVYGSVILILLLWVAVPASSPLLYLR